MSITRRNALLGASVAYPPSGLTPCERRVVKLTAQGYSSKEIARQLNCSPRTIEVHRGRAMAKMGIRSNKGLGLYAVIEGMISEAELEQFTQNRIARLASKPYRGLPKPSVKSLQRAAQVERDRRDRKRLARETDRANALRLPGEVQS